MASSYVEALFTRPTTCVHNGTAGVTLSLQQLVLKDGFCWLEKLNNVSRCDILWFVLYLDTVSVILWYCLCYTVLLLVLSGSNVRFILYRGIERELR